MKREDLLWACRARDCNARAIEAYCLTRVPGGQNVRACGGEVNVGVLRRVRDLRQVAKKNVLCEADVLASVMAVQQKASSVY